MKRPKITLLDLGGVVFQSTGTSNEKMRWEIISRLNYKYGYELNIGKDKYPTFLNEYNRLTGQVLKPQEFLKEVFDTLKINTELIELVKRVSEIIIVSDNYRENIDYISKRYHFNSWASKQIYSYDYEMVKSNPDFFELLLKECSEYAPDEMIFIDDSIEKIQSAEQNGIAGIHYQNNEQIKKELEKYRF